MVRSASSCLDASLSWLRRPPSSLRRLAFSARATLLLDTCMVNKQLSIGKIRALTCSHSAGAQQYMTDPDLDVLCLYTLARNAGWWISHCNKQPLHRAEYSRGNSCPATSRLIMCWLKMKVVGLKMLTAKLSMQGFRMQQGLSTSAASLRSTTAASSVSLARSVRRRCESATLALSCTRSFSASPDARASSAVVDASSPCAPCRCQPHMLIQALTCQKNCRTTLSFVAVLEQATSALTPQWKQGICSGCRKPLLKSS